MNEMNPHRRVLGEVRPAIFHGVMEWAHGASPLHAIAQTAAMSYFIGQGRAPREAVRIVEQMEEAGALPTMYGRPAMAPAERYEYYHRAGWAAPAPGAVQAYPSPQATIRPEYDGQMRY